MASSTVQEADCQLLLQPPCVELAVHYTWSSAVRGPCECRRVAREGSASGTSRADHGDTAAWAAEVLATRRSDARPARDVDTERTAARGTDADSCGMCKWQHTAQRIAGVTAQDLCVQNTIATLQLYDMMQVTATLRDTQTLGTLQMPCCASKLPHMCVC